MSRGGGQRSRVEIAALVLRPETIPHGERVLRPQLQIEASREIVADVRTQKADAVVGVIDVYAGAVLQYRIRNLPCIHALLVAPLATEEKRSSLRNCAAYRSVELIAVIRGNRGGERIAGIEGFIVALDECLPVQLIGSRLGENLDAPIAQPVEFSRKGILVDANLANRRLGRKLPAAEAVDVDLAAVGSGRGSGQRRQLVRQFIRIVGERVQIRALEDDGAGVAAGFHIDGWRFVGDLHALLLCLDGHGNIHPLHLAGRQRNRGRLEGSEAREAGLHNVAARRQAGHRISSSGVRGGAGHSLPRRGGDGDRRAGDQRARWVGDVAAQSGCGHRRGSRCRRRRLQCRRGRLRGRRRRLPLRGERSAKTQRQGK